MARNNGKICVLSDEGNELFQILAGKHSSNGGTESTLFTKAWSGERVHTDRVGRDYVGLEAPLLNVVIAIQPDALRGMVGRKELAGQGVLDRFAFAFPVSRMTPPDPPAVPGATRDHYAQGLRMLLELPLVFDPEHGDEPVPAALHMDVEAREIMIAFNAELNERAADGAPLEAMRGWVSKLKANFVRVAGVLHMANFCSASAFSEDISAETMQRAVEIARYWIEHAVKIFDLMEGDPQTVRARRVWDWIKRRAAESKLDEGETFRKVVVWQGLKGSRGTIQTMADLNSALRLLCEAQYLRRIEERPERYEVNPEALTLGEQGDRGASA